MLLLKSASFLRMNFQTLQRVYYLVFMAFQWGLKVSVTKTNVRFWHRVITLPQNNNTNWSCEILPRRRLSGLCRMFADNSLLDMCASTRCVSCRSLKFNLLFSVMNKTIPEPRARIRRSAALLLFHTRAANHKHCHENGVKNNDGQTRAACVWRDLEMVKWTVVVYVNLWIHLFSPVWFVSQQLICPLSLHRFYKKFAWSCQK